MILLSSLNLQAKDRESTLSMSRSRLRSELGRFLGYGRTESGWSASQTSDIDECLEEALRQVYFPDLVPGIGPHSWSFLEPTTSLAIVASQVDYDLPRSFGSLLGRMTFSGSQYGYVVTQVPEWKIRELRQTTSSGRPQYIAIRIKAGTGGDKPQRWQALVWPTPDAAYTLDYKYAVLPSSLDVASPNPLGGASVAGLLLQSTRAAAERLMNDNANGPEYQRFMLMLASEIERDRREHAPDVFGYCGDASIVSSRMPTLRDSHFGQSYVVTYTPGA